MRLEISLTCVAGVVLAVISVSQPWLMIENFDRSGGSHIMELGFTYFNKLDLTQLPFGGFDQIAFFVAMYLIIIGIAITVSSMLGGFVQLAGVALFAIGGVIGEGNWSFGLHSIYFRVYPGIGFYLAIVGVALVILSMKFPLEVGFGKGSDRPRFRTWHLSRAPKPTIPRADAASEHRDV